MGLIMSSLRDLVWNDIDSRIITSLRDLFWHRFIPFLLLCFFDVDLRILFERAVQIQIIGVHFQMREETPDFFFGVV